MPVQLPTKFNLIINPKTAQAIGLAIPSAMLVRADRLLERGRQCKALLQDRDDGARFRRWRNRRLRR
jgi:hypothetical protein